MINLTTLAPEIQAAILDETLPDTVSLFDLVSDTPLSWEVQRGRVGNRSDRQPIAVRITRQRGRTITSVRLGN